MAVLITHISEKEISLCWGKGQEYNLWKHLYLIIMEAELQNTIDLDALIDTCGYL